MKLFIFRRDLRLCDNQGLNLIDSEEILPVFLLDPQQVFKSNRNKHFFSTNALQFMCESLVDLDKHLHQKKSRLVILLDDPISSIEYLVQKFKPSGVVFNADWSAYALKRDEDIQKVCKNNNIPIQICTSDSTLHPLSDLTKSSGEAYLQFGAFYKNAFKHGHPVLPVTHKAIFMKNIPVLKNEISATQLQKRLYAINDNIAQRGGRSHALKKLKNIQSQSKYNLMRDRLDYSTSMLSGALNFGCISIREAYFTFIKNLGKQTELLKQLYWRDFFLHIVAVNPLARSFSRHIDSKFDKIKWEVDELKIKEEFNALWNSKTGFLIVDAAIAEMRSTGFMHNRARMIVGVFWTKYLRIHILHEKYGSQVGFSSQLLDAIGPSQNKLNHHWITELDLSGRRYAPKGRPLAGRPMNISNSMIKKWDPDAKYIKKWLPHLKDVPVKEIYKWGNHLDTYKHLHPAPMFDISSRLRVWIRSCRI